MKFLVILFSFLFSYSAFAETITIEMLNKGEDRSMGFSEEIVRVNVGDTIFWQATDPGHNVEFIKKNGTPEGFDKFK